MPIRSALDERHHSVQQVATVLDVDTETIRRLINEGTLRAVRVRGQFRVPESAYREWYAANVTVSAA